MSSDMPRGRIDWKKLANEAQAEVARLTAELAAIRTGDTCGRQCEGTAYRITARTLKAENERLTAELAEANSLMQDACKDSNLKALELEKLRAQEPIAWCDDPVLAGGIGNCASASAKRYWERGSVADRFSAERLKNPLFARPTPAAQAVPDDGSALLHAVEAIAAEKGAK